MADFEDLRTDWDYDPDETYLIYEDFKKKSLDLRKKYFFKRCNGTIYIEYETLSEEIVEESPCNGLLILKQNSNTNSYFWGCSNFPDCDETRSLHDNQKLNSKCPICSKSMKIKKIDGEYFYLCSDYPKCKTKVDFPMCNITYEDVKDLVEVETKVKDE